ncbi:hypothetical protein BDV12DRAFT_76793 [Aspergillus spectabilis]
MPTLTPQDSFNDTDSIPETFFTMAADTTTTPTPTQCNCNCLHQNPETTPNPAPAIETSPPPEPRDRQEREIIGPEPRGRLPLRRRSRRGSSISPNYSPVSFLNHTKLPRRPRTPSPTPLPEVPSHTDLFTEHTADRSVLLTPFNREAYITTHTATHHDFTTWLPLLALGAPETWYAFSVSETPISTSLHQPLIAPSHTVLKPLSEPRPVGLKIPRIAASAALQPSSSTPAVPNKSEDRTKQAEQNLIYLSIQTTISGLTTTRGGRWVSPDRNGLPELAGRSTTGQNIYRVVRAGSREEAAAQAFYNAGGNRWSTVFTCVVVEDSGRAGAGVSGRVMVLDEGRYVRVSSLEGLGGGDEGKQGGGVKVFY